MEPVQAEVMMRVEVGADANGPAASFLSLATIDEPAIIWLDEAARSFEFDADILRLPTALDIQRQIQATIAAIRATDHQALLAKQGFLARLTGADVEARLKFELAGENVLNAVQQLRQAATNGARVRRALLETRGRLVAEQARFDTVIDRAHSLLGRAAQRDEYQLARFERKLANLRALHASNVLAIEQIALSDRVLAGLLDRLGEVDGLLFPLWQRQMLAVAGTVGAFQRAAGQEYARVARQLIDYLDQDTDR